jgi:hypothetical protein
MTGNCKKKREIGKGGIKFKKACPDLIELLTDPYYNKTAPESIGEIK